MRRQPVDLGLESVARASKTAYQQQRLALTVKLIISVESASLNCRQLAMTPFVEWDASRDDFQISSLPSNIISLILYRIFSAVAPAGSEEKSTSLVSGVMNGLPSTNRGKM